MATNNSTILEKVWLNSSNDFQQRIPRPTQGSISKTVEALFNPMNRQYFNDFMQVLINRIAFTYVRGQRWDNKLAVFKGQKINYGSTIQEIAPNWIRAHAYNVSDETLLKLNRPEAQVWYHSQNRQDRYDISVSYDDLRTAFVDEYGLNNFIAKVMEVPINSDEYDEYRIMLQLIAEYENSFGFYKEQISAVTDETTAKALLKKLREMAGMLEFPSARYNAADVDIPVFAKNSELVLLMTPAVKASIDVDALAMLFNLEKGEVNQRIVIVDEFPIPNVQALLTTEDFFVCHDTVYENTNFWNPQTLVNNYYLHHWGIYSVSPFVPAILFTTESGTSIPTVTQSLSAITLTIGDGNSPTVEPGKSIATSLTLTGTLTTGTNVSYSGDKIELAPDAATYEVSATRTTTTGTGNDAVTTTESVPLNARTYVDKYGVLHVQKSGLETGDVITVVATCTYVNPSGSTSPLTDDATVTIA